MQSHIAGASTSVGQLMILNLEAAKQRIGSKWPHVSRHVHMLVENILSRRLGRSNIYFRCEEGLYAIVFSELTREEAEDKCRALSIEIMSRLFGETTGGLDEEQAGVDLAVHGQASELAVGQLPPNMPFTESIKALVVEKSLEAKRASVVPSSFESVLERSEEKLARLIPEARRTKSPILLRRMKTLVQQLRELERSLVMMRPVMAEADSAGGQGLHAATAGAADRQAKEWTLIAPAPEPLERLSALLARAEAEIQSIEVLVKENAIVTVSEAEARPAPRPRGEIVQADEIEWQTLQEQDIKYTVDFLPLIDLETGVKGIYAARIRFLLHGRIFEPETLVREEKDAEIRLIADRLLLRNMVSEIKATDVAQPLTLLPIDQTTLDNISARRHYLQMASQFTEERRRLIIFELQLHTGWQSAKISNWLSELQPYCRAIFVRLPLEALPSVSELRQLGAWSVKQTSIIGIAMPFGTTFSVHSHAILDMLKRLGDAMGLRCYVMGINRVRDLDFCKKKGIRYITSEPLLPAVKNAVQIERVDLAALMSAARVHE